MNRYLKTIKFVNLKKNFTPQWHTIQIHFILSNETFFLHSTIQNDLLIRAELYSI